MGLAVSVASDAKGLSEKKWGHGWELLANALFAHSIYSGRKEFALASLVMRGLGDAKESWSEFRAGNYIKSFGKLALAAVRGYRAVPQARRLRRDWYGKRLTQADLEKIFSRVNRERLAGQGKHVIWGAGDGGKGIDFDQILAEGGFSSRVESVSFAAAVEGRKQG